MAVKSHKKRIIILSVISAVLIAVLGFGFYSFSQMSNNTTTNSGTTIVVKKDQPTDTAAGIIAPDGNLSNFETYLKDTAQFTALDGAAPYTVFVFTNDGFKQSAVEVKEIFKSDNKTEAKKDIMNYHIVSGSVEPEAMNEGQRLKTLNGAEIVVKVEDRNIYLKDMKGNEVKVDKAGIPAKNGTVYIINGILLPQ